MASHIQDAEEASFAPLEVELEGINQKIEESIDFQKLSKIERYGENEFNDILNYLEMSNFIRKFDDVYYEFNNIKLWETVLKNITHDSEFEDINIKKCEI